MIAATGSGGLGTATWATEDGNNGNIQVQGTGNIVSNINNSEWGVFARCNTSTLAQGTSNFVEFMFSPVNGWFAINQWVGITETQLFSVLFFATPSTTVWYQVTGLLNGTSVGATVQRLSDNFWLNMSTGVFQSSASLATGTATTVTGQGYSGWEGDGPNPVYGDNWSLSTIGDTPNQNQWYPRAPSRPERPGSGSRRGNK